MGASRSTDDHLCRCRRRHRHRHRRVYTSYHRHRETIAVAVMPITTAIGNNVSAEGGEGEACIAGGERKRRDEKVYARVERQLGCCWLLLPAAAAARSYDGVEGRKR